MKLLKLPFDTPIAHRGLHDDVFPENSLGAYRAAVEAGFAIETDIRFTKDGKLVILHDDSLERMTGDKRTVNECTMSEIKALKFKNSEEHIPTFRELLDLVDGRVPLLIEIKDMPKVKGKTIAAAANAELEHYKGAYAMQSFNPLYMRAYKKLRPDVPCGILAYFGMANKNSPLSWKMKAHFLERLSFNPLAKPDFISYGFWTFPQKCVTKFKGEKLAWTIHNPEEEAAARKYAGNIIFEGYLPEK